MARMKHHVMVSPTFLRPRGARCTLRPFENEMLKYYPKRFRIFHNSQLSQDDEFLEDEDHNNRPLVDLAEDYSPHLRILRKYRADFFQYFKAFYDRNRGPTRIPHNIKSLVVREGPSVFLKKLIKQNKGLKHITLHPEYRKMPKKVVNYLKYSKGLCSIRFQDAGLNFSERTCRNMRRNWKNTIQRVEMLGNSFGNPKRINRFMKTFLKFLKLKELIFLSQASDRKENFPLVKLQERDIAYDVRFRIGENNLEILRKKKAELKPVDQLIISERDFKYEHANKGMTKEWKFQNLSQKILRLDYLPLGCNLLGLFEKISSLDVKFNRLQSDYSSLGHLNNLKNLSLNITNAIYLKDFLEYFHKNVTHHVKLETISLKGKFMKELSKENSKALIRFFGVCSKTVRKANFELKDECAGSDDYFADFYKFLSKLKHLQSLSLCLSFADVCGEVKQFEKIIKIISEMKSLEELNFKIENDHFEDQKLILKFPSQLKKLSLRMVSYQTPCDLTKTLSPLSNLIDLELEFDVFNSQEFRKVILDLKKLRDLERFVLKEVEDFSSRDEILRMRPIFDTLMKECLSLKLIIFVNTVRREAMILRRNCSWSEINLKCDELSSSPQKSLKMIYIKSY